MYYLHLSSLLAPTIKAQPTELLNNAVAAGYHGTTFTPMIYRNIKRTRLRPQQI